MSKCVACHFHEPALGFQSAAIDDTSRFAAGNAQTRRRAYDIGVFCIGGELVSLGSGSRNGDVAQDGSRSVVGGRLAGFDAVTGQAVFGGLSGRNIGANDARPAVFVGVGSGQDDRALAGIGFAIGTDGPGTGIAIRYVAFGFAGVDVRFAAGDSDPEYVGRDRRGVDLGVEGRGSVAFIAGAAPVYSRADIWHGCGRGARQRSERGVELVVHCRFIYVVFGFYALGGCASLAHFYGVNVTINWFKYSAPSTFYGLAGKLIPWFAVPAAMLFVLGLYIGFFVAPMDAVQGEAYRIIFIHVPASILSMFLYLVMAGYAALGLIFNTRLSSMMATALAPTGALFAFISLWTGALWGKPMWGAWWVWDARLTSELILLFLYFGFIALHASIDDPRRADRAAALLAIVGSVNVPIIYFSVKWWNTLHQGSTIKFTGTSMHIAMQQAMFTILLACWLYAVAVTLVRVRSIILERERNTQWVSELKEVCL